MYFRVKKKKNGKKREHIVDVLCVYVWKKTAKEIKRKRSVGNRKRDLSIQQKEQKEDAAMQSVYSSLIIASYVAWSIMPLRMGDSWKVWWDILIT